MKRLALLILGLALALPCHAQAVPNDSLAREHGVKAGWVTDDVLRILMEAQRDTVERMFQVVNHWRLSWHDAGPYDSAYVVRKIVACKTLSATDSTVSARCPNPYAPTIHTHVRPGAENSCSPSPRDYAFQITQRHEYDAIECAQGVPVFFFWRANPYLYLVPLWRPFPPDTSFRVTP